MQLWDCNHILISNFIIKLTNYILDIHINELLHVIELIKWVYLLSIYILIYIEIYMYILNICIHIYIQIYSFIILTTKAKSLYTEANPQKRFSSIRNTSNSQYSSSCGEPSFKLTRTNYLASLKDRHLLIYTQNQNACNFIQIFWG